MIQRQVRSFTERTIEEDLDFYALPGPPPSGGGGATVGSFNWILLGGWTVGWIIATAAAMSVLHQQANSARISEVRELRSHSAQLQSAANQLAGQNQHNLKVWGNAQTKLNNCLEQFNKDLKEVKE